MAESGTFDRIQPTVRFEEQRDEAVLATPKVSAMVDGANWEGSGEVLLGRRPRPAIEMLCLFDRGVGSGPARGMMAAAEEMTEVVVDGRAVAGFGTKATPCPDDDRLKVLVEWRPGQFPVQGVGEGGTQMERVRFSLFNFAVPGELHHNGTSTVHRLALSDEEWTVSIEGLMPPEEVWKRINKDGGVHVTHAGSVSRSDGANFTGEQACEVLGALEYFLAFAAGRKTTACCPVGTVGAEVVWSMWSSPERWEAGRDSWLDHARPESLGELFPGFMARWRAEGWEDALGEAVYWYGIANDSARGIDAGLPCAQTALERLSYEVWARKQKVIDERVFRKMGTAKRVRTLLVALDVRREIPSSAASLRKALEGKPPARQDAAEALADIRNDLVHGGRGRADIPPRRFIEAWTLSMWIVEMAILTLCGYSGWHWNRNSRESERVPWAGRVGQTEGEGEEAT